VEEAKFEGEIRRIEGRKEELGAQRRVRLHAFLGERKDERMFASVSKPGESLKKARGLRPRETKERKSSPAASSA
jgi:hypothetical protein